MGFFDGLGRHMKARAGGVLASDITGVGGSGLGSPGSMAAEADATRIRLSDHVYEGVSRVPPPDTGTAAPVTAASGGTPMPGERPDPRAQWDDLRGCWIIWDVEGQQWNDLPGRAAAPDFDT